jgi:polyisoprenyl-teichoic acid--peptidoglycan teichoic acid transferase
VQQCELTMRVCATFTAMSKSCIIVSLTNNKFQFISDNMSTRKHIDFLNTEKPDHKPPFTKISRPRRSSIFSRKTWTALLVVGILLIGLIYSTRAVISGNNLAESLGDTTIFDQLKHLVSADNNLLAGEKEARINILLLGIGGENHDGGQLTDTIIIASINPDQHTLGLLSIPRDLVVPIPGIGWQKINAAHAYGVASSRGKKNAGAALSQQTIEDITKLNIHYYVKLDFEGFTKMVDALGGVRVNVQEAFTDTEYPDENFGYAPVTFESGWQHFSGTTALKYVRSRHGTEGQGTDFARAGRQQQVLQAIQNRAKALSTLLNPNKLLSLAEIIGTHVETNMEIWEVVRLFDIVQSARNNMVNQVVLSTKADGLLSADTNEEGTYLLRPKLGAGNFSEIQTAARNLIATDPSAPEENVLETKKLRIVIQNGTSREGLASRTAQKLKLDSYVVTSISNAVRHDYEKTVIYALSQDASPDDIRHIRETLNANIAPSVPAYIETPDADILIIVGINSV